MDSLSPGREIDGTDLPQILSPSSRPESLTLDSSEIWWQKSEKPHSLHRLGFMQGKGDKSPIMLRRSPACSVPDLYTVQAVQLN